MRREMAVANFHWLSMPKEHGQRQTYDIGSAKESAANCAQMNDVGHQIVRHRSPNALDSGNDPAAVARGRDPSWRWVRQLVRAISVEKFAHCRR
jgi:hypothetical protein